MALCNVHGLVTPLAEVAPPRARVHGVLLPLVLQVLLDVLKREDDVNTPS